MLIRFQVANHRSIKEPVELSMVALDRDRPEARPQERLGESLVPIAALYGPNASGKSNVLSALVWLIDAVWRSLREWDDLIPVTPFAFAAGPQSVSSYELELTMDGVRFEYLLDIEPDKIAYEALFEYPEGRRRRVFERSGQTLTLQRGLGGLAGIKRLWTPRTLVLAYGSTFEGGVVSRFASEVALMAGAGWRSHYRPSMSTIGWFVPQQPTLFGDDQEATDRRLRALALLRLADRGIADVELVEDPIDITRGGVRRKQIQLAHQLTSGARGLPFADESEGTKSWFSLIGPVLAALEVGSVLVVDELDRSLHPALSATLLELFHSPETNPRGAQLLFTTHDTSLLAHLNRDEVWFTEKRADGSTRLGPLSDFASDRVRRSANLQAGYLSGRFGALPSIDDAPLLRALGLIG